MAAESWDPGGAVREEDGELVVDLPKGVGYAALALRIDVANEEEAHDKLKIVADAVAEKVANEPAIRILWGPEALAALDFASRQWAMTLGLNWSNRRLEVNRDEFADHLRRTSATGTGVAPDALLPWEHLQESEQAMWLRHVDAALGYLQGA